MRIVKSLLASALLLALVAPSPSFASETAAPSAHLSTQAKIAKSVLTLAQKVAIFAARSAFATAKANAQGGFDRAVADARAILAQSVLDAGTDKIAIAAAWKTYRDSYRVIENIYKTDMTKAKSDLRAALAAAYSVHATT